MHQQIAATSAREQFAKPLFVVTIIAGSFLLFLTQPMVARMALPRLGGAPAVWNSAMLVYQALLLGGYAYAHWLSRIAPRRQAGLHLAVFAVAALWLPIGLSGVAPPADAEPAIWVPWFLISSIGPVFFVISAQAPLMQRWYALESSRGEPYALYAASNLGSFAGLICYPLVVEPLLTLEQQSLLWTGGYALLVLLVVGCALTIPGKAVEARPQERTPAPSRRRVLHWIALAAIPSGLMLSTTTHLTTDIVAMPLLWVLPLGLYLLSFVIAFATRRGPAEFIALLAPLILLIAGGLSLSDGSSHPLFSATLGLSLLFVVAVAIHGEMYRLRPGADRLTGFYLAMSVGGMLGGVFCAILAPLVFDWAYEHPLLILGAALLIPQRPLVPALGRLWADPASGPRLARLLPLAAVALSMLAGSPSAERLWEHMPIALSVVIALLTFVAIGRPWVFAACLAALMMSFGGWSIAKLSLGDSRTRSYFGIYQVGDRPDGSARTLTHGTTLHGIQNLGAGMEAEPTTYYGRRSGVGLAMSVAEPLFGPNAAMGVVGLGTGTLACYAKQGQDWRFFEIDPAMVQLARDSGRFTFLRRCAPTARMIVGDARLTLAQQPAGHFDMLAIDAFSSDSIPIHLLTKEAIGVYGRALKPDGILLIHISNRYLDLRPVLAEAARAGGWSAALRDYRPTSEEEAKNVTVSVWVAMSRNEGMLNKMIVASGENLTGWEDLQTRPGFSGWTDDYATILPLLKDLRP